MERTANDKRGEAPIAIGEQTYVLRLNFRAMRELKGHFGHSVQKHFAEMDKDDIDLDALITVLEAGLRHGGNPLTEDELLDRLDMAHLLDYVNAMQRAMGVDQGGQPDGEDPPISTTTS